MIWDLLWLVRHVSMMLTVRLGRLAVKRTTENPVPGYTTENQISHRTADRYFSEVIAQRQGSLTKRTGSSQVDTAVVG